MLLSAYLWILLLSKDPIPIGGMKIIRELPFKFRIFIYEAEP